MNSNRKLEYWC